MNLYIEQKRFFFQMMLWKHKIQVCRTRKELVDKTGETFYPEVKMWKKDSIFFRKTHFSTTGLRDT